MEYMDLAIEQAKLADGEIPVGAVIIKNGEILAKAFNTKEQDNDVTSHAEIIAIREASQKLKNWRLEDCELYVTLEPCPMCGWAILQSHIKSVYFGSYDTNYGAFCSKINLCKFSDWQPQIYGGIKEKECDKLLENFFKNIRNK